MFSFRFFLLFLSFLQVHHIDGGETAEYTRVGPVKDTCNGADVLKTTSTTYFEYEGIRIQCNVQNIVFKTRADVYNGDELVHVPANALKFTVEFIAADTLPLIEQNRSLSMTLDIAAPVGVAVPTITAMECKAERCQALQR